MMHTKLSFADRVDERFRALSLAIATQIDTAKGDWTQGVLGDRVGKGNTSVSRDLSGEANLSLKTIVRYEVALDEMILSVPEMKQSSPSCGRRRQRPEGGWTKPDVREDEVDPIAQRLHRLLTRLSRRIRAKVQEEEDLTQTDLAERVEKSPSYVSRLLGGGVNVTLKTIATFEIALGTRLLSVAGNTANEPYRQSAFIPQVEPSNDGGYCKDKEGIATRAVTFSNHLISKGQAATEDEELQAA